MGVLEGMKDYWVCVGGANVDVQGSTSSRLLPGTSNPGTVRQAAGGVARNVAENLAWLKEDVHLFALVGEDADGGWLRQVTANSGVATHGMFMIPGQSTGRYLAIRDVDGELHTAVADTLINEAWTEEMVQKCLKRLPHASGLFLDANLPSPVAQTLLAEARRLDTMVIVDPVSVRKAEKLRGMLEGVHLLVASIDEIEVLCGKSVQSFQEVEQCASRLITEGVHQVMVICGEAGLYVCREKEARWLTSPSMPIRGSAADAFVAGVIYALQRTSSLREMAAYGIALAELSGQQPGSYDLDTFMQRKEFFLAKAP